MRQVKKSDWAYILLFSILVIVFVCLGCLMYFNDKNWSYGDFFNLLVAFGTMILALATTHSQQENRETIDVATRSAIATEKSVESMKDALMPQLVLSVECKDELNFNTAARAWLLLFVRNVGPGSGTIRLASIRDDLTIESTINPILYWAVGNEECSHNDRLVDFTFGTNEEYVFRLKCTDLIPKSQEQNSLVSSMSLFYEDVYGRFYRSRIIFSWTYHDGQLNVASIGREFGKTLLPIIPMNHERHFKIHELEGGKMFRHVGGHEKLYRLQYMKLDHPIKVTGSDFTKNKDIIVTGITFNWTGFPVFEFHIEKHELLKIEVNDIQNGVYKYKLDSNDKNLADFGFALDQHLDEHYRNTYNTILNTVLK